MSGKKGTTRTATLKETAALKKNLARMAKKWGWSIKEFEAYCLRMGVNRVMALERYTPGGAKKASKKKAARRPAKKAARKASSKPRKSKVAKTTNHAAAPATPATTANATG